MKAITLAFLAALAAGSASAQSGFGASSVESGEGAAASDSFDLTGLEPEDQTPTGKFTTAAEIGMILEATKDSWAAVREYNGKDWVYFTHVMSWRCGLKAAKYSINDGPLQDLQMPDCHMKFKQPNSFIDDDALMTNKTYDLGSVQSVRVDLLLDNLTVQSVTLQRGDILIP